MEGILSIDNAAVLGAMVVHLPDDEMVTWPTALRKVGYKLHKFLRHIQYCFLHNLNFCQYL